MRLNCYSVKTFRGPPKVASGLGNAFNPFSSKLLLASVKVQRIKDEDFSCGQKSEVNVTTAAGSSSPPAFPATEVESALVSALLVAVRGGAGPAQAGRPAGSNLMAQTSLKSIRGCIFICVFGCVHAFICTSDARIV